MIDSTDKERLETAATEFNLLLQEEELKDASLCLMANKQVILQILLVCNYQNILELFSESESIPVFI